MSDPLISIVIPCYNAAAYLGDCVQSVLRQEADCEIILVDDGSTDDTLDRARRLMHEHVAMVVVACQRNLGPAASRNTGLRLAQGKYICFLDVDDRFVPGFFATALSLLEADPSTVAVCCRIELVGAHRAVETWHVEALEQSIPGNMIIRTEAVRQIGGFPVHAAFRGRAAGEDVAFRSQLTGHGKVLRIEKPLYQYRVQPDSHFDLFLDRATLQDGRIQMKYRTEEEENGSLYGAMQQYEEVARRRRIARIADRLRTSATASFEFQRLQKRFARIEGYLQEAEGFVLYWLARHWPADGRVVEVGCFKGRSTCWLASGCKEGGNGKVAAVDHFRGSSEHQAGGSHPDSDIIATGSTLRVFGDNIKEMGLTDWVDVHVGDSADASSEWHEPIRLLFLDGDHSFDATTEDFLSWSRFVTRHGLVVFHDVGVWPGVTEFYTRLCREGGRWKEVLRVLSLGIVENL